MTARVSIADVVKETLNLLGQRKKYAVAMFFPLLAVMMSLEWLLNAAMDDSAAMPGIWWISLFVILLDTVIQASVFNYFITSLRNGNPRAVPERLLAKTGRVLLREIAVILAVLIPGLLVLGVCVGISFVFHPGAATDPGFLRYFQWIVILGVSLGFCWPILRLGAGIAGATVDEKVSFTESWRMTRGHSLGLFLFFVPMMVIPALTSWVITPEPGSYGLLSPETLISGLLSTLINSFYYVGFSVWYVRLRERYAAMVAAGEAPADDKISSVAVVKEAISLSWSRKWTFWGLVLVGVLPVIGAVSLCGLTTSQVVQGPFLVAVLYCLAFVLYSLATAFVGTAINHLAVTLQRGRGKVLPHRLFAAMWRVFVRSLILMMGYLAGMVVLMGPLGALFYLVWPQDGAVPDIVSLAVMGMLLVVFMVCYFLILGFLMRFAIMIPGAAVGHLVKVREAFAITKGYVWRMFCSMLILVAPSVVLSMVIKAFALTVGVNGSFGLVFSLSMAVVFIVSLFWSAVMLVTNAVWYEKLRLRYEGGAVQPESDPVTGVGPYADVPTE